MRMVAPRLTWLFTPRKHGVSWWNGGGGAEHRRLAADILQFCAFPQKYTWDQVKRQKEEETNL